LPWTGDESRSAVVEKVLDPEMLSILAKAAEHGEVITMDQL
jgi:hypothetical protein